MFNKELLESLSSSDKEELISSLKQLIDQTYIAENEFKQLKELFLHLTESLPNAIWILEEDGSVFLQNSYAKEFTKDAFLNIKACENGGELKYNKNYYLIQQTKKLGKQIITATDITEEKRKERLASMGQVSAHLAHEIRNPVGSVALLASTLLKKVDVGSKPLVYEIKKSIWRVERIVKATLLFSKGLKLNRERFKIGEIQDEIEMALGYYTYSKEIESRYSLPDSYIYADLDLLSIVFQNFVFNAIDAIEDDESDIKGCVEVAYEDSGDFHKFLVFDNGKPIENEKLLFEPFKSTKTKGHGLGLALSMQIINAHGGDIKVHPGKRKGFEITIRKE